ncbi:MAG: hypothetical protein AAGI38_22645 [Bacteroidota bacterium]
MKHLLYLGLLGLLLWASGCNSTTYTADSLPPERILFGSGGGITGMATTYCLLENGQLFKMEGVVEGEFLEQPKVKKRSAKESFELARELGIMGMNLNQPGDLYSFIEYHKEGKKRRLTWGVPGNPAPEKIILLYKSLVQLSKTP